MTNRPASAPTSGASLRLLAGPQPRRSDEHEITIWLATSAPAPVTVRLYSADSTTPLGVHVDAQHVQLGVMLHIYLVRLHPVSGSFPRDCIIDYELDLGDRTWAELDLTGPEGICLPGRERPGFVLATQERNLLFGSCRKPHGDPSLTAGASSRDALARVDALLTRTAEDLTRRPGVLVLAGDQIYADDVAASLAPDIVALGRQLCGTEYMPDGTLPDATPRAHYLAAHGFTSDSCDHHLLPLGEYAAMYLFTLGGLVPGLRASATNPDMLAELACLKAFFATTAKVRRVLANIVSYTMFDDHEVTDDWNIDYPAYYNGRHDPVARRVQGNALLAYWAFQGWGNNPVAYDQAFLDFLNRNIAQREPSADAADRLTTELLTRHDWHYVTATEPPLVVLDTRTQRSFTTMLGMVELQNADALDWLQRALTAANRDGQAIVVAATPVYGFAALEYLQGAARRVLSPLSRRWIINLLDAESWITVRDGFFRFMHTVCHCGVRRLCVLSGDVHYGFVNRGRFNFSDESCEVLQFTSSALHNAPPGWFSASWLKLWQRRETRRMGHVGTGLRVGIAKLLRPWVIDLPVFLRLWRPDIRGGRAWFDQQSLEPLAGQKGRLVTSPNIGLLGLEDGQVRECRFLCSDAPHEVRASV